MGARGHNFLLRATCGILLREPPILAERNHADVAGEGKGPGMRDGAVVAALQINP